MWYFGLNFIKAVAIEKPTPKPTISIQPDFIFEGSQDIPIVNGMLAEAVFPKSYKLLGVFSVGSAILFAMALFITNWKARVCLVCQEN